MAANPTDSLRRVSVCPACGGSTAPWLEGLAQCSACGTAVTLAPPPGPSAYETGSPRLARLAAPVLALFDRRRLSLLGAPRGTLLDVGAGRGRFVAAARDAGWTASGIEPSERGVSAAEGYAVTLRRGTLADVSGTYDAVVLWHVLEHIDDPDAAVGQLASLVAPGGTLLIGVPNLASVQARLGGLRWFHLDLPRHRTHFTPGGLRALLERHGFVIEREEHALLEHNPFGLWQTLVNRFTRTPSWLFRALKRDAPLVDSDALVTLALLPLAPLCLVAERAFAASGRGGTIAIVARRAPD
jgi:SAM-dependent methyltransferase